MFFILTGVARIRKELTMMKALRIGVGMVLTVILIPFCAFSQNAGKMKNNEHMKIQFPQEAYSGGMMEVQLGKLSQQNASSFKVKEFGERMINDHSKANKELKGIAEKDNIKLPDNLLSSNQKTIKELSNYKGREFDQHYMKKMVEDHKEDIKAFENAAKNAEQEQIRQWAQKTLPTLKQHLKLAEKTLNGLEKSSK